MSIIYSISTAYILGDIEILVIITNIEDILKSTYILIYIFSILKFYNKKGIINLKGFFGIRIFFSNSISLLTVGLVFYTLKSFSLDVNFIILVVILTIIWNNIEIVIFKFYVFYDEIRNDHLHLLKLNIFFKYISFYSTRIILLNICLTSLSVIGHDNVFINFIIELLTISLFNYIFSIPDLFYSSNNIRLDIVDLEKKNKIIDLLVERSDFTREGIIRNFDLSDRSLDTLCELLDFNPNNTNKYIFSTFRNRLRALPEEYYKYYRPISNNLNYVDTFHRLGNFNTFNEAKIYLNSINGKCVAMYDSRNKFLYLYVGRQNIVDYNRILYVWNKTYDYVPYDPTCYTEGALPLFLKDLNGQFHSLDIVTRASASQEAFENSCGKDVHLIKKLQNGEIISSEKDASYFCRFFSIVSTSISHIGKGNNRFY